MIAPKDKDRFSYRFSLEITKKLQPIKSKWSAMFAYAVSFYVNISSDEG